MRVISYSNGQLLEKPKLPEADMKITLPNLGILKTIVDRLRNLDNNLIVTANSDGYFSLSVTTDTLKLKSDFGDLRVIECKDNVQNYKVMIDTRDLTKVLPISIIHPCSVVCSMYKNCGLLISANLKNEVESVAELNFYIPNKSL